MLHAILKRLAQEGWQVDAVATRTETDNEILDGVNVYKGPQHKSMISKKYDLIITQFSEADYVLPEAERLGIPTVYVVHNNLEYTNTTLQNCSPTLTVYNTNWIKNHYNRNDNSIVVHPPVYAKNSATVHGDAITLVNLIPSKGVYCFYNMAERFKAQPFLGVIGGYFKDQQVVQRKPNVTVIDTTSNMKEDVWAKTKILLMPSDYESYGMAGVEALASGIPVIANDTPGLRESLSYAGIFPKTFTIGDWQAAIQNLLNPVEYEKASKLALQRSAEINPDDELDALVEKIKEII